MKAIIRKVLLIAGSASLVSCATNQNRINGEKSLAERRGTIIGIVRISSESLKKKEGAHDAWPEVEINPLPLSDSSSVDNSGEQAAYGLGGSLVYSGVRAYGARDSLKITIRMEDGTTLVVTQKVKIIEHFGIGERIRVMNDGRVTH